MNKIHLNFIRRKIAFKLSKRIKSIGQTSETPSKTSVLLVATKHELSETQMYPFYWYQKALKQQHGIEFCEIDTGTLHHEALNPKSKPQPHNHIKRIFFQAEFEMPEGALKASLGYLQKVYPQAKIAFMDWYAPLHIRPATIVNDYIDLYIKKHSYRDFSNYDKQTVGDTNLSDYYAKRHNLNLETMQFTAPDGLESKMMLWTNFGFSPQMMDLFLDDFNYQANRSIDLHARLAVNGTDWYKAMRQESKDAVDKLTIPNLKLAANGRVKRYQFFKEMTQSKLCFSPFGYGEVCWRDYESFATGALLLKPNMDHLMVDPDIFIPNETYIALNWDLSDFEDQVKEYYQNSNECKRIARNAFDVMRQSITNDSALDLIVSIIHKSN